MIALLPTPYSGTLVGFGPVMVVGFDDKDLALTVDSEGLVRWASVSDITIDWRYDWKNGVWVDISPYEEINGDEEEADDRGEEVPGDLPDPDGADGSGEVSGE